MKAIPIVICVLLATGCMSGVYAGLQEDKNDLVMRFGFVEEDAVQPVLRALYARGLECYDETNFKDAAFYFSKVIDIDHNYQHAPFLREAMNKMQQYPLYEAKDTVVADYYEQGRQWYAKGQYLKALSLWERLLVLNPPQEDFIRTSIHDARRLLADPYYERGWNYYKQNDFDKAIEEWEQAIALDPTYKGLSELLGKTKQKALAIAVATLVKDATELYGKDKLKDALSVVNQALQKDPTFQPALTLKKSIEARMDNLYYMYFNKGLESYKDKRYEVAMASFRKSLDYTVERKKIDEIQDYIRRVRYELTLLERQKKVVVPIEEAPKPVEVKKVTNEEEVRKYYNQGLYYYKNGYLEKAIIEWERVLNLDPENERAYTSLQRAKAELQKR